MCEHRYACHRRFTHVPISTCAPNSLEGADVNARRGNHGNAQQAASSEGAVVNAGGGMYGNALQAASCNGSDKTVQLLLDKDAENNI